MFTQEEITNEKVDGWLAALESEKNAVAVRVSRAKQGLPDQVGATAEVLDARAKAIDAEIKRVKGLKTKADRESGDE